MRFIGAYLRMILFSAVATLVVLAANDLGLSGYQNLVVDDLYKRLSQQIREDYSDYNDLVKPAAAGWQHKQSHAKLRDHEYLEHSSLLSDGGFQYISGGAGEGNQHLTPDGTQPNTHKVISDDVLPFYCHPPNPCPKGFTEKDGCTETIADTAEVQKEWISRMQDRGMCSCDQDHMFTCSKTGAQANAVDTGELQQVIDSLLHDKTDNPFGKGDQRLNVVAKKSPRVKRSTNDLEKELQRIKTQQLKANPYLMGPKLGTAAKKGLMLD